MIAISNIKEFSLFYLNYYSFIPAFKTMIINAIINLIIYRYFFMTSGTINSRSEKIGKWYWFM